MSILDYAIFSHSIQLLVLVFEYSQNNKTNAVNALNNIRESIFNLVISERSIISLCDTFLSNEIDDYCDKILKPKKFKDFEFIENLELGSNNPMALIDRFKDIANIIRSRPNHQKDFINKLLIKTINELILLEDWESSALAIKQLFRLDSKECDRKDIVNTLFTNTQLMQAFLKDSKPKNIWRKSVEITKHGTNQRLVRNILVSNEYLSFISMSISWGIPGELLLSLGFHVIEVGTGKAIVRHDILRKHRFFLENSDPIAQLALKLRPDLGDDRKNQISEVISEVISWLESKFRHAEFHYDKESQNIEIIGTSVENQVIEKGLRDYNLLFPDPIKIPARYNIEASRLERVVIPAEINSNINAHIKNEFEFHSPGVLVFIPGSTRVIKLTKDEKYSSQSWRNSIGISAYDL